MKPPMGSSHQAEPVLEHLVFEVAQGIAAENGPGFFESLVRHLARALPADFVFAGAVKPGAKRVVTLASFGDVREPLPAEFDLAGTPFEHVTPEHTEPFSLPVAAAQRFPDDPILREIPGDGYVGAPLVGSRGNLLGVISAVTRGSLPDASAAEELVRIFSALAARELERITQIESLERQNAEVRRATEEGNVLKSHLERDSAYLRDEIRIAHPAAIGSSPEFRNLMNHVRRAASTSAIVLIQGESGTGKELAARAIHNQSSRRKRPLVKLDCVAVAGELLEVELFGGLRDPQSEAAPRVGRLDFADEGTLLIDEVAELPLDLQAKLLRVIQQREFRPLGFSRTSKVDVRLLVTTNRDLQQAVREGRFRSDLLERLLVDPVQVPPLRRRRPDIPLLADHFLRSLELRLGREGLRISERMMSQMMTHDWPGNIRELKHLLYRAALTATAQGELDVPILAMGSGGAPDSGGATDSGWTEPATLEEANRRHVNRTLGACHWVIEGSRGAAAVLNIPPSTLRSLMKRLNIQRAGKTAKV
jgi:formate hydrogenlyase transcriptional activator